MYQASVTREDNGRTETYTGLTARSFKERLYEHTQDINNKKRQGTSLSNYVWKLKKQNVRHKISWKILSSRTSFNPATRRCNLCLREKFCIIFKPEGASLNSRSELVSTSYWKIVNFKVGYEESFKTQSLHLKEPHF